MKNLKEYIIEKEEETKNVDSTEKVYAIVDKDFEDNIVTIFTREEDAKAELERCKKINSGDHYEIKTMNRSEVEQNV